MDMTVEEREAFLADVHVGILAIERKSLGPHALPIWYQYEDGDVLMGMSGDSLKATLLRAAGIGVGEMADQVPRQVRVEQ